MLHKPWRCEQNLENNDETWKSASRRSNIVEPEQINISLHPVEDEDGFENNDNDVIFNDTDWMAIIAVVPIDLLGLGNRDIDIFHDWNDANHRYQI